VLIGCIYLPNGNPQPGPKFDYKLAWFDRLLAHAATLREVAAPVVLAGDLNVVPTDFDIYPTKSWGNDPGGAVTSIRPTPGILAVPGFSFQLISLSSVSALRLWPPRLRRSRLRRLVCGVRKRP
jgi:hypothetical protein